MSNLTKKTQKKGKSTLKKSLQTKNSLQIGIDLGGTKTAIGLVDQDGKVLLQKVFPTLTARNDNPKLQIQRCIKSIIENIINILREHTRGNERLMQRTLQKELRVGLAAAGPLDVEKGLMISPSNFPGWGRVPIVRLLQKALNDSGFVQVQIGFQNDAIASALAEAWIGSAKKCKTFVMITLGTGVGTGVILNGSPAQSRGQGSEWGHMLLSWPIYLSDGEPISPLSPYLNSESYFASAEGSISGPGLLASAQRAELKYISLKEMAFAAEEGNEPRVLEIFDRAAWKLAAMLFNLSLGFYPEKFVLGGGVMNIQHLFVPQAIKRYQFLIKQFNPHFEASVQTTRLTNSVGIIGAASLVRSPL